MYVIPFSENIGVTFRQWRAESHCRFLHQYKMQFEIGCEQLDPKNLSAVYDLRGSLLIAQDDPNLNFLMNLTGFTAKKILPMTGCEGMSKWLYDEFNKHQHVDFVICREHLGNFGGYNALGESRKI